MDYHPVEDLKTPHMSELRALPYDKGIMLHLPTKTRWYKTDEGVIRDHTGEQDWASMGKYVGKSYEEVFLDAWLRTTF